MEIERSEEIYLIFPDGKMLLSFRAYLVTRRCLHVHMKYGIVCINVFKQIYSCANFTAIHIVCGFHNFAGVKFIRNCIRV